jgi:hypothetical protein
MEKENVYTQNGILRRRKSCHLQHGGTYRAKCIPTKWNIKKEGNPVHLQQHGGTCRALCQVQ